MFLSSKKGFTLLELIVVVAIISILSSIVLVPNLLRFSQKGKASSAKASASQLATAYELAGSEGCTNFTVSLGAPAVCDSFTPNVTYIQQFPAQPSSGPRFDFNMILGDFESAPGGPLNPSIDPFPFEIRDFLQDAGHVFHCESGTCFCSAVDGCQR